MMKALGSAASQAERDIEAAMQDARALFGEGARYAPVSGGISNSNWRVQSVCARRDWFVKIPGNGTEMFIDRVAAMDASRKAAAAGLGPKIYEDLAHQGVEINDFIPDRRPSTHADFGNPANRAAAIVAYRQMHALPALGLTKTVFDMIDEHHVQMAELGSPVPRHAEWIALNTKMARDAMQASGLDLVPSFNDPMPGNFMIGADGSIMLIDYEYASMNDRCYDLGIWFGEMFYTPEIEAELIEEYFGRVTPEIVARVTVHKALADVKWAAWSMVQLKVSALDFDFYKYGVWKLMRFQQITSNPAWKEQLRRL